jgi:hypothetical protein
MQGFNLTNQVENVLGNIIAFLPNVLAAILILIIGGIIASVLGKITRRGLQRLRFDRAIHSSPVGATVSRVIESPSYVVGRIVYWLVMIGVISLAVAALNLPALNSLLAGIYGYVPNILAAVLIFLVASAVSTAAVGIVQRTMGRSALAKLIATAIPAITMSIAVFMILNQLQIARDIVNILFTGIVGSLALGLALAFGLGGREVARELLEQAVDNARAQQDNVKAQVSRAAENARRAAKQ